MRTAGCAPLPPGCHGRARVPWCLRHHSSPFSTASLDAAHPVQAQASGLTESQYDNVRGGAVVLLGTLARHLDPQNPKVGLQGQEGDGLQAACESARHAHAPARAAEPAPLHFLNTHSLSQVRSIVGILLDVLTTPSESVQRGVSDCMPALMQARALGAAAAAVFGCRRCLGEGSSRHGWAPLPSTAAWPCAPPAALPAGAPGRLCVCGGDGADAAAARAQGRQVRRPARRGVRAGGRGQGPGHLQPAPAGHHGYA